MNAQNIIRWIGHGMHFILILVLGIAAMYYQTSVYLIYQGLGQLSVLKNTQSFEHYLSENKPGKKQHENLQLINEIKRFSIDSLQYVPTDNFTKIYNDADKVPLWVVTASKPYELKAYTWTFPLVGEVSYKGFFKKELALKEYNHLVSLGYDVDLRGVSAWSTLGWFNDPVLSSALERSKGSLCNLMFHELFHATFYAPGSVDLNENLANFVAHKATIRFLRNDTTSLNQYLRAYHDRLTYTSYMLRSMKRLESHYRKSINTKGKYLLKLREIFDISDSIGKLPLHNRKPYLARKLDILKFKNACFIDLVQYDSKQDSLEEVFNKIYGGKIENLVRYLRQN
ncbi:MAG: aminopeptidase [Bacteroidia bacterium]|nr:aminopeptidase [Bacteroidia bacterium]